LHGDVAANTAAPYVLADTAHHKRGAPDDTVQCTPVTPQGMQKTLTTTVAFVSPAKEDALLLHRLRMHDSPTA
jgi:hypothetical protein